jgi:hypothetical protein
MHEILVTYRVTMLGTKTYDAQDVLPHYEHDAPQHAMVSL